MKKIVIAMGLILTLTNLACSQLPVDKVPKETGATGFIQTSGTQFYFNGNLFKVAGANYHILNVATFNQIDNAFNTEIPGMHLNTIRFFGFWETGSIATEPNPQRIWFHNYIDGKQIFNDGPDGMQNLDYTLYMAKQKDIKIIYVLVDNWKYHGGVPQYCLWAGGKSHDEFFTDSTIKAMYKNWVSHILDHVNYYTGIAYKNDPTIMAWELGNELTHTGNSFSIMNSWISEMSAYIKSLDNKHLVCVGAEGRFNWGGNWEHNGGDSGQDFDANLNCSTIDFGTCHAYPQYNGQKNNPGWNSSIWIPEHITAGNNKNKPVVIEEFGWTSKDTAVIGPWLDTIKSMNGAGWCFWDGCAKDGAGNTGNFTVSGGYGDDTRITGFATPYDSDLGIMYKTKADVLTGNGKTR
jgi:mannan endo-1,4-beta-mannosidase